MNKNMLKIILVFATCMIAIGNPVWAQQTLSLKAAIDSALLNNVGIKITKNNSMILSNNSTPGNAGMLPALDVNGGTSYGINSIRQETSSGVITDKSGVTAKNISGSVALSWTIFDGAKMFATYKKLQTLEQLGELQVKQQISMVIAQVSAAYFELYRQQMLLEKSKGTLRLYEERMRLAEMKLTLGSSPKTELLQAKVDLNTQRSIIQQLQVNLKTAGISLNNIIMHSPDDSIVAIDSTYISSELVYGTLLTQFETGNMDLQEQLFLQEIADQEVRETKSGYLPELDFNAGYNFNKSTTSEGFFRKNQSYGPGVGLGLRWNLFNGGMQRSQVRNAQLRRENAQQLQHSVYQDAKSALATYWQNYQGSIQIIKQETESEQMAYENLDIVMKRFRLSESNVIELREAQRSLEEVQIRLANAIYTKNITATSLLQLTGLLLQNQ
jgi:outer membrane protein